MSTLGKIEEFDSTKNDLESYTERLEQYFIANDVNDEKKTAVLLSVIGPKTYETIKSLIAPQKPATKTYEELKSTLMSHFKPKPLVIYERFKFHKAMQGEHESVAQYIAKLRGLAHYCEFGTFLDDSLRDKFVCGLRMIKIQQRLLQMEKLTLAKAIEIAQSMEHAEINTKELQEQFATKIHKVSRPKEQHDRRPDLHKKQSQTKCYRCGYTNHTADKCKYKEYTCNVCKKKGHLGKVCRSTQKKQHTTKLVESENEDVIFSTNGNNSSKAFQTVLTVNRKRVTMEIDTGSGVTVMPESTFKDIFQGKLKLQPSYQILKSYTGTVIPLKGEAMVTVQAKEKQVQLKLLVAQVTHKSTILGRDWLEKLKIDWTNVFTTETSVDQSLEEVIKKHKTLFSPGLGELKETKAKIHLKDNAQPRFFKPRPVPYAVKSKVEEELKKLERENIVTKVSHSEWAAPLVVVPKENGKVRLCGDFKVTINQEMKVDQYPLPTVQDLFATLANGQKFSKLDLTQAYHQMAMDESSKDYVTINTHIGLFRYNRMPYGIASGPAIFQRNMEQILAGLEGVQVFIDDIRLTGADDKEHLQRLDNVLQRLKENGVKLNKEKCEFLKDEIHYLGHTITADGLQPQQHKVKEMLQVARPENVKELRSFLGGVQYYGKFLPNLSATLKPLNELLKKEQEWFWTEDCEQAFQKVKMMLNSKTVLTHYDQNLPLLLATDASPKGLGAVLSHRMPNGEERPICYASRSLTKAEGSYAQIEKEALGIIFGVKKFHQYLYGRIFTLITDHKPLLKIFGPKTNLPSMAAARIQRWSVELCAYQYEIEYKRSEDNANADMLSRLPRQDTLQSTKDEMVCFSYVNGMPISVKDIASETKKDPTLAKVLQHTLNGWPSYTDDPKLKPYFQRKEEITVECGVLQWGVRVIVPDKFKKRLLNEIHEGHQGINKTKAIARSYIYWPSLDKDIETMIKECENCAKVKNDPAKAPVFVWTFPANPWERVHIDFAEYQGQKFLMLIDAYSKWPEIIPMKTTTAEKTNDVLRQIFSRHGLPMTVVSDNGPPFTSSEFEYFLKMNGIRHVTSQSYKPSTNGSAERLVQTFKQMMKSAETADNSLPKKLAKILLQLRSSPHALTGKTPAELLLKRKLRIRLDLIKPSFSCDMRNKQEHQIEENVNKKLRSFQPGEKVKVRNYRQGFPKWSTGTVLQRLGPVSYAIRLGDTTRHCHIDQLQRSPPASEDQVSPDNALADDEFWPTTDEVPQPLTEEQVRSPPRQNRAQIQNAQPANPRYPRRLRKPVDRLNL